VAVAVDVVKCDGCGVCEDACPQRSLEVVGERAVVNEGECVECGGCVEACPVGALALTE
jgi:NAD-dependent dihydropyrimidine dehydrogenase PreA subunit